MYAVARIVHRTAQLAARYWRFHDLLVTAGFEERRLLAGERQLRCPEAVKRSLKPDHLRVEA
jgi:hypothetical protein